MAISETIITGKKYRVWDKSTSKWKRMSYWTKASDVEFNDGSTAEARIADIETNLGSPSTASAVSGANAFAKINTLNSSLDNAKTMGALNLIDYQAVQGDTRNATHVQDSDAGIITVTNNKVTTGFRQLVLAIPDAKYYAGKQLTFSLDSIDTSHSHASDATIILYYYINGSSETWLTALASDNKKSTVNVPATANELHVVIRMSQSHSSDLQIDDYITVTGLQLELGNVKSDYQPYAQSNAALTEEISLLNSSLDYCIENGVKNLLEIDATSDNFASIVATVLGDTVVINGTSTSSDGITVGTLQFDDATKVKLSGCPSGGGENTYYITIKNFSTGTIYIQDNGSGAEGTIPANTKCRVQVGFKSGVTFNDTLFKPMVTLARVTDSDYAHYVPFAKPNYLLTPKTILSENYTQNTANTLEDTGLSFTLEKAAFVALRTDWSHGKPLEIAVSKDFSSNNAQQFHFDYTEENSGAIFTTPVWLLPEGTYHISIKRNGTGTNRVAVVVLMELDIRGFTS